MPLVLLADRPQRAIWVTSVRMRREDRSSISSHPRTLRVPSAELERRVKENPQFALANLTNMIANRGALPIKVGDDTIGAAGASGAPGGDKDEACVKVGIDKIAADLK